MVERLRTSVRLSMSLGKLQHQQRNTLLTTTHVSRRIFALHRRLEPRCVASDAVCSETPRQVFGYDTLFVTSVEDYEASGVLFKGNLRGDAATIYPRLAARLKVSACTCNFTA